MRSVAVHALLAAAALVAAYLTWTREPEAAGEASAGEVTLLACKPEALTELSFESPRKRTVFLPAAGAEPGVMWAEETRVQPPQTPASAPADAGLVADAGVSDAGTSDAGVAPAAPPKPAPKPFRYLTSDGMVEYLRTLLPLRAERSLGVLPSERLPEFELDAPDTRMHLTCGGQRLSLEIGGRTYGSGSRYVRRADTGEVVLLDKRTVQDLQSARFKFMRKALHGLQADAIERITVAGQGSSRTLLHRKGQAGKPAHWVDANAPDTRNALFDNWMSRVDKLKVRAYLADGAQPGSELDDGGAPIGAVTPVMTLAYADASGKTLEEVEVVQIAQGQRLHFYAKSGATRGWSVLNNAAARQAVADLADVLGTASEE